MRSVLRYKFLMEYHVYIFENDRIATELKNARVLMIVKLLFIVIGYSVVRRPLAIFNFLKIATESTATIFDLKHFLR